MRELPLRNDAIAIGFDRAETGRTGRRAHPPLHFGHVHHHAIGIGEGEGAQIHRIRQFDDKACAVFMLADARAEHDGLAALGIAAGRRPAPWAAGIWPGDGQAGGGGRTRARIWRSIRAMGSSVPPAGCAKAPATGQTRQNSSYNTDIITILFCTPDHKAKLRLQNLPFGSGFYPHPGPLNPCRRATGPLQVIPMLLRPGLGRKVQWSGCPAVSPGI